MDVSCGAWFSEPDMVDPRELMNQEDQEICSYSELMDSFSSQSYKGYQSLVKRNQYINAATISEELDIQEGNKASTTSSGAPILGSSPNTFTISFGSSPAAINQNQLYGGYKMEYHDAVKSTEDMNLNELLGSIETPKRVSSTRRNRRQAQEHILAERKRREKLTQRFISLSALLPEIKKTDKATVLEDASKYIKHLQNRVKELEETSISGKNIIQESTTSLKTSKIHGGHEHDASSFDETNSLPCNTIKVRISGSSILVRIYCERNALLALKVLNEMERLHFTVMCNNALPISATTALIIVTAEMSEEFVMTAMDLVKCLQSSLSNFL
ncbi:hypothetical protein L1987_34231 [Smallanthus sonchifolius]|uniref:Uncharacterized protein n=1 Tax=Smallanthus sonchifolius TaxID=185202 RepID=A0ACB9HT84_9ASTR|nr:hypothetical protein L1987_34231 [Smallanthus sonchifolius]